MKEYKEVNGTFYNDKTSDKVIDVLEYCRNNKIRVILDYGDTKTGKSWNEVYNIAGRIGRSTGKIKIPILVYNTRSLGGSAILDNCIIEIKKSKGKKVLYSLK